MASYRNLHAAQTVLVCGCGVSMAAWTSWTPPSGLVTIGVNDIGRLFTANYLVVVNPPRQFRGDRFSHVRNSRALALFTHFDLGPVNPPVVRFKLGRHGGTDIGDGEVLHHTQNSPYVAVCLAAYMGAKRIGLIGVDFTDHHFFGATGGHPLASKLDTIDREYGALAAALAARGVELVNLSPVSRLTSLPKADLSWLHEAQTAPAPQPATGTQPAALRIVSYATTPVAGVPSLLARCIAARTAHEARCVWATGDYGNGVCFTGDVQWRQQPAQALALLEAADAVIVHNGKVDPAHRRLIDSKPVITLAHNYAWNVDMRFVRQGQPGLVVGQYQATLPEFAGWQAVPNPVPIWEAEHQPGDKGDGVCIAYTPSGRHESYPPGHRLYWHGKGFDTTMRVLERLARVQGVRIETTAGGQVSHAQALAMKRRAHIVIDECVTGSYHRNSLEGLSVGAVVVNGVGLLAGVEQVLRACAPGAQNTPFVFSGLETLEQVLQALIDQGAHALAAAGRVNRAWMEQHWRFEDQWARCWQLALQSRHPSAPRAGVAAAATPVAVAAVPAQAGAAPVTTASRAAMPATRTTCDAVSVVIPHAGADRLAHLAASLRSLAAAGTAGTAGEVIVVESGTEPLATALCHGFGARHIFAPATGPFERGRLLNLGTAQARSELVLWLDNDLVFDSGFIPRALAELGQRRLDALLPYRAIHYLAAETSAAVMAGTLPLQQARPDKTLLGGRQLSGGMGLLRRSFFEREGGVPEGFRGWGGEDNAWAHKAALLGRYAVSTDPSQQAWHLHHGNIGAFAGTPLTHPDYAANLALLAQHRALHSAAAYRRRFASAPAMPAMPAIPAMPAAANAPATANATTAATPTRPASGKAARPLRNVFACLVHESPECVIDLVRNLRHFDPPSRIVLYDGSPGGHLLDPRLPWQAWGATLHPAPRPMKWGALHGFALDCIRLLQSGEDYDTLTVVDSDQLLLRPGYSAWLTSQAGALPGLGVLSNRPERQDHRSTIAPVKTAQAELALWRSWLEQFEGGVDKWVHWSFWPSTVITRAAGQAVLERFDHDGTLATLLASSRLWATEEILFPTLAALLGFRVERNPCSDQYLQFRKVYGLPDVQRAFEAPQCFWMHPVPRNYGDPVRHAVRKTAGHYGSAAQPLPSGRAHPAANPWLPVLRAVRAIEGWLEEDEAELLALTALDVLARPGRPRRLLEIGSYCGKATCVLAHAIRLCATAAPGARVMAVDAFDGVIGALDSGLEHKGDTRARFDTMLRTQGLADLVDVHVGRAATLALTTEIDLLLVDGLHDYASAVIDFHAVAGRLADGALVAFHDCAPYFPGVCSLVAELVAGGAWREKARVGSLCVLERAPPTGPPEAVAANRDTLGHVVHALLQPG